MKSKYQIFEHFRKKLLIASVLCVLFMAIEITGKTLFELKVIKIRFI